MATANIVRWGNRIRLNLIIIFYLLTSYYPVLWWLSAMGTIIIIFLASLLWKREYKQFLGIGFSMRELILTAALTYAIMIASAIYFKSLAHKSMIDTASCSSLIYVHIAFYSFNEEMILGALLLNLVSKQLYWFRGIGSSLIVAIFFVFFHLGLFWLAQNSFQIVGVITLISLVLISFIRNNLILITGHISYAWALHFGILVTLFSCSFIFSKTGNYLSELELQNIFLSEPILFCILVPAALITGVLLIRRQDNRKNTAKQF